MDEELLGKINELFDKVNTRLDALEKPAEKIVKITDNTGKYPDEIKPQTESANYILVDTPPAWRAIVNTELGEDFEMRCEGFADRPNTRITITVPESYWSGSAAELADRRTMGKKDERSIIVQNSMAVNQLKDRVQKIKLNIAKGVNAASEPLSRLIKN